MEKILRKLDFHTIFPIFQVLPTRVDFSANPMSEPTFEFYDKTLLDDVNKGVAHVHEFFRLLALCHTVMPEYKDGK